MSRNMVLWAWFTIGALLYMGKRAFYMMKKPRVATTWWPGFFQVAAYPLFFRHAVNSGFFWLCFSPEVAIAGLNWLGLSKAAFVVSVVTKFAAIAFMFGLFIDVLTDWAIPTIVGKIPVAKDFWPQMPGPCDEDLQEIADKAARKMLEQGKPNLG